MALFPGTAVGFIGVTGISNYTVGPGAGGEVKYGFNSFQVYDDLFWTEGNSLVEVRRQCRAPPGQRAGHVEAERSL